MTIAIRPATAADIPAIQAIYAHHVLNGLGTFEEVPPDESEMATRLAAVEGGGLPWLVAESSDSAVGYAYAAPFRLRSAYRYTVEDSIYIAPGHQGQGIGKRLLHDLIAECRTLGLREMLAVIGDSGNLGSIRLHETFGFQHCGILRNVGLKFGRWVDVVMMQLTITTT